MGPHTSRRSKPPPIPPIRDESAVVGWFLTHDPALASIRTSPTLVEATLDEVARELAECRDGPSLKAAVQKIAAHYDKIARPQAEERRRAGGPKPGEGRKTYLKFLVQEVVLAGKLRILRYFLEQKYGLRP